MQRTRLVLLIVVLIFLPIILMTIVNFDSIAAQYSALWYSRRSVNNPQFTIADATSELKPSIKSTAFLEYEFSRLGVFKANAVTDPDAHRGKKDATKRYTVKLVDIAIVPTLESYLVASGGVKDFAARGTYHVQNDTLYIELSINTAEIPSTPNAKEDVLLRTLLETLLYAIKAPSAPLDMQGLFAIQQDMQKYISTGIFDRPFRIEESKTIL